jgi:hypothetical protein
VVILLSADKILTVDFLVDFKKTNTNLITTTFLVDHSPSPLSAAFRKIAKFPQTLSFRLDPSDILRKNQRNSWRCKEPNQHSYSKRCNTHSVVKHNTISNMEKDLIDR